MSAIQRVFRQPLLPCAVAVLCSMNLAFAMGGTSQVAVKGEPAHVSKSWPQGTGDLVNDPMRTKGWSAWFSEWPNDVNHYAYEVESTEDVNRLIAKLAAIKGDLREIHLSPLVEPDHLGFVSRIPKGNGIPVLFSIGDQAVIDRWFKQVEKPFGKIELTAAPEAMAPTLTLFVQNPRVKLDELEIPDGIILKASGVPTAVQTEDANKEAEDAKKGDEPEVQKAIDLLKQDPDGVTYSPMEKIRAFLDSRKRQAGG